MNYCFGQAFFLILAKSLLRTSAPWSTFKYRDNQPIGERQPSHTVSPLTGSLAYYVSGHPVEAQATFQSLYYWF